MARLIDGYERSCIGTEPFGDSLFRPGVIMALFHDMGYVRELDDRTHGNGAGYTLTHVSRGSRFLKDYLPKIGMAEMADIAAELIHFTGYEMPVGRINVPSPIYRFRFPDPRLNRSGTFLRNLHQRVDHFVAGRGMAEIQLVQILQERSDHSVMYRAGHAVNPDRESFSLDIRG